MPSWSRSFLAGVLVATGCWLAAIYVLLQSGSACLMMGELAEQWTADELRPLRRDGWKLINRMLIKRGDIDHVLVGPSGVVVVETKWRGEVWNLARPDAQVLSTVRQAQGNARDVRRFLGGGFGELAMRPVVACWDPENASKDPVDIDGVVVVPGPLLHRWVASLTPEGLPPDRIDDVWRLLEAHLAKRDAWELEQHGEPLRGAGDIAWQWSTTVLGAGVGAIASAAVVAWLGVLPGVLATATVLLGIGWFGLRWPKARSAAVGWIGGTQFVTVALLAAFAFDWLS